MCCGNITIVLTDSQMTFLFSAPFLCLFFFLFKGFLLCFGQGRIRCEGQRQRSAARFSAFAQHFKFAGATGACFVVLWLLFFPCVIFTFVFSVLFVLRLVSFPICCCCFFAFYTVSATGFRMRTRSPCSRRHNLGGSLDFAFLHP